MFFTFLICSQQVRYMSNPYLILVKLLVYHVLLRNVCETFELKIDVMSYILLLIYPRHATVLKSSTNHYKSLTRHKCINSFAQGMQKQNKYGNYEHFRGLLHRKNNLSKIALFTHFIILPFGSVGSISLTYNAVLQITILIFQSHHFKLVILIKHLSFCYNIRISTEE